VFIGAVVDDGLHLHLHGGALVSAIGPVLERALATRQGTSALIVYAPDHIPVPIDQPVCVETVRTSLGVSEIILLPRSARDIVEGPDLQRAVREAIGLTQASVVALAGVLPARTGLATRALTAEGQLLTTGHGATVVAMVRTIERALAETGRTWSQSRVGLLGYGAIGRAVHALAKAVLGEPASWVIVDPGVPGTASTLGDADLILGASSGGATLNPMTLAPGTLVIDDSFPRAFDDRSAILRMTSTSDVLLMGGGLLDVGPLERTSPFPEADAIRTRYGASWLPGCHAEAVLLAAYPELGATVGVVDRDRALALWQAVERAGWTAPPLHLGAWVLPERIIRSVWR
jgi:hypothetical protein